MQIGALVMPVEKSSNIFPILLNHKLSFMPRMSLVSYAHLLGHAHLRFQEICTPSLFFRSS